MEGGRRRGGSGRDRLTQFLPLLRALSDVGAGGGGKRGSRGSPVTSWQPVPWYRSLGTWPAVWRFPGEERKQQRLGFLETRRIYLVSRGLSVWEIHPAPSLLVQLNSCRAHGKLPSDEI